VVSVPVPVRDKLRAVTSDLGSQAEVARTLGVSRSRVSRWLRDEDPDGPNRRKLEGVEFVLGRLLTVFEPATARKWLHGFNDHLGGRRPLDLLGSGRVAEVLQAIEAEETDSYA
jgi:transcriptional regulator with XRE-family HTH domain